jgi:ATP-dependent Clp protease ATP-binding subunit ClpA
VRLSRDVEIALSVAVTEAERLGHEYAGAEHLLYALTFDDETAKVLGHAGADLARVRRRLADYLEKELERGESDEEHEQPRLSLAARRVLARAAAQVESSGREEVQAADILVALFAETESWALALLAKEGVSRLDVVTYLAHGASRAPERQASAAGFGQDEEGSAAPAGDNPLEAFTQDLTELARRGSIDPLIGREREIERTLHILRRRRKNNPLYVGDPGVGKTALVEGLALKIAQNEVPEAFRGKRIFRLDLGSVLAGTRYRGDFENRLKAVLGALREIPGAILFIDEIHTLVGAGSAGRGTLDASNLLKPALEGGTLRCIGATTWEDFRQNFERDPALARRFQKVEVPEVGEDEAAHIFGGLQSRYEEHHGVTYAADTPRAAAALAARFLRDRKLPDSAIDLLDETGATVALRGDSRVEVADVEKVLASMAQIPARQVQGDDRERLRRLPAELAASVFGQDEAIERLSAAIQVARAGLRDPQRPVGCFLLTGPTGVGKTEIARQLAAALGITFLRFDMSEYMERHTVSRLVGAPPGYVGYDRGGLLTEAVAKNPHAVLLLDEIEKAHEDVFNLLLQIMDHGTLTDTNGKATDFRHVILLMTSNVGAREMARRSVGFGTATQARASSSASPIGAAAASTETDPPVFAPENAGDFRGPAGGLPAPADHNSSAERAFERLFSPEFRNRLDARLQFRPLTLEVMEKIVTKMGRDLGAQLAPKNVQLEITPEARRVLAERGHDSAFGARPLARLIEDTVKRPLTQELLWGALQEGGTAVVDVEPGAGTGDETIVVRATAAPASPPPSS